MNPKSDSFSTSHFKSLDNQDNWEELIFRLHCSLLISYLFVIFRIFHNTFNFFYRVVETMARNTTNDRETASALWSLWQDHERRWKYGIQFRKCCITSGQSSATISQPTRPRKSHSNTQGTWNNSKYFSMLIIAERTRWKSRNLLLLLRKFRAVCKIKFLWYWLHK